MVSRLVALTHGCRFPPRVVSRALELLQECCELVGALPAHARSGGSGGSAALHPGVTGGEALEQQLLLQLPGIRSALGKLLRCGYEIEAFHLQLLADFLGSQQQQQQHEQCSLAGAPGSGIAEEGPAEGERGPPAKRPKQAAPEAASGEQAAPEAAAAPARWAERVAAAKRALGCLQFRELAAPLGSADVLQQYAALLVLMELFRGHIGVSTPIQAWV